MEWEKGLTWEEIKNEIHHIDEINEKNNKKWKDPKFVNQIMKGPSNEGKLRKDVEEEWSQCSFHEIKHRWGLGGCPICYLKTCLEEKRRIGETGF